MQQWGLKDPIIDLFFVRFPFFFQLGEKSEYLARERLGAEHVKAEPILPFLFLAITIIQLERTVEQILSCTLRLWKSCEAQSMSQRQIPVQTGTAIRDRTSRDRSCSAGPDFEKKKKEISKPNTKG